MSKQIVAPIDIQIRVDLQGKSFSIECTAHYGRTSEGLSDRIGTAIILSDSDAETLKTIFKNTIFPKMNEKENITEKKFEWEA